MPQAVHRRRAVACGRVLTGSAHESLSYNRSGHACEQGVTQGYMYIICNSRLHVKWKMKKSEKIKKLPQRGAEGKSKTNEPKNEKVRAVKRKMIQ